MGTLSRPEWNNAVLGLATIFCRILITVNFQSCSRHFKQFRSAPDKDLLWKFNDCGNYVFDALVLHKPATQPGDHRVEDKNTA